MQFDIGPAVRQNQMLVEGWETRGKSRVKWIKITSIGPLRNRSPLFSPVLIRQSGRKLPGNRIEYFIGVQVISNSFKARDKFFNQFGVVIHFSSLWALVLLVCDSGAAEEFA